MRRYCRNLPKLEKASPHCYKEAWRFASRELLGPIHLSMVNVSAANLLMAGTEKQSEITLPLYADTSMIGVSTVKELWAEWQDGIANQPSIQHLENTYDTKWRQF
ncbi:hypothetical protein PHMEG_00014179 [Phytophthora megakarya]|uniref:Transcription activator GCR1-like domain-containing protein n=1 Tax=Phytophthora megakarya TaxID=4795 RepID=A0A225W4E7_9STRA|nr:hypothetical protein PHMEG_00014179 [Phytophthora megakarya]